MCCLISIASMLGPRLGILVWYLLDQARWRATFDTWLWPLLGIIFLPFTTLMYVILWSPGIGLAGWDWFWLVMAVVIDVMHYSSTAYSNRNQIPGYKPASTAPATPPPPAAPQ